MQLNILDRLTLLNILAPVEGNVVTLRVVRDLQRELSFTDDEVRDFQIVQEGSQVRWTAESTDAREFEFNDTARKLIRDALQKISDEGKLTLQSLDLAEKFLEGEDNG